MERKGAVADVNTLAWAFLEENIVEKKQINDFLAGVGREDLCDKVEEKVKEISSKEYGRYLKSFSGVSDRRIKEYFLHDKEGIWLVRVGKERKFERIVVGDLQIFSRICVDLQHAGGMTTFSFALDGERHIGDIDLILDTLKRRGRILGSAEDTRRAISAIVANEKYETIKAKPACGLYVEDNRIKLFLENTQIHPSTSQQEQIAKEIAYSLKKAEESGLSEREVVQASAELISSMPKNNLFQAIIVRGWGVIAPIAHEIKSGPIGIFPYIYLFGEKGSSKTHLATTATTKTYGELSVLNSESVETPFRLGMEFSATTFPRVVDEAHDIFVKNLAIFKSAATGVLATKRGTKERNMIEYPALCSFAFTSNIPPIMQEEDAQNAVSERVVIVKCMRGVDFRNEMYQRAMATMNAAGALLGKRIIRKLQERNMTFYVDEIMRIAGEIAKEYTITQRRAYCLASVVLGVRLYYEILEEEKIFPPFPFKDESHIIAAVCDKAIRQSIEEEVSFLESLVNWADAMRTRQDSELNGVYSTSGGDIIITRNAMSAYKKFFARREMSWDLELLASEFAAHGFDAKYGVWKDHQGRSRRGIRIIQEKQDEVVGKDSM